jgi:integrase
MTSTRAERAHLQTTTEVGSSNHKRLAPVVGINGEPTWPALLEQYITEYPNPETRRRHRSEITHLFTTNGWHHPHEVTADATIAYCTLPTRYGPRANNSVRARIAAIRGFLTYCKDAGVPVPDLTKPLRRLQDAHPQLLGKVQARNQANRLTADQLQALYDACSDGSWIGSRDQILIRLLALGLRRTETLPLTWAAVDADGTIRTKGKGGKLREVHPGPQLRDLLAKWRRYYEKHVGPATGQAPILVHWTGNRTCRPPRPGLGPMPAYRILRKRADLAGIGHLSPHTLRRSLARIMWETTADTGRHNYELSEIAHALGHSMSSLYVTQGAYIGPLDNRARKAAGKLVD